MALLDVAPGSLFQVLDGPGRRSLIEERPVQILRGMAPRRLVSGFRRGVGHFRQDSQELLPFAAHHPPVVKARVRRVCCSMAWALAEPVAGLPLAWRRTERTGLPTRRSSREWT
jgi:hypothetical protein